LVLFTLSNNLLSKTNVEENDVEMLKNYKYKAVSLMHHKPDSALYYLDLATDIVQSKGDSADMANLYFIRGIINIMISKDKTGVKYLHKAANIFKKHGNERQLYGTYSYLGLYSGLENEEKISMLNQARDFQVKTKDTAALCNTLNNLGLLYYNLNDDAKAEKAFMQSYKYGKAMGDDYPMYIARHRLSMIHSRNGNFEKALSQIREAFLLTEPNDVFAHQGIYLQMANYFYNLEQTDSALFYMHILLKDGPSLSPEISMRAYQILTCVYKEQLQDFKTALSYRELYDSLNTIILEEQGKDKLAMVEMEYKSRLDQADIIALNATLKRDKYLRNFTIIISALLLLITIGIILSLKQRAKRQTDNNKLEKQLLSTELRNTEIEKELLNKELKYTNKELTSFACNVIAYKEILHEVKDRVNLIKKQKSMADVRPMLMELNLMLVQMLNSVKHKEDFVEKSETLNSIFIQQVKEKFPNLMDGDINLLIMVLLKFDYKEIASIYNISGRSVITKRSRLRKKLAMPSNQSFDTFFSEQLEGLTLT
jgi:tetratricopeptide (TPR) repeat protein